MRTCFDKFQITNQDYRYEISKLIVASHPHIFFHNFDKFSLADEKQRFNLAQISAKAEPWLTALKFQKFAITNLDETKVIFNAALGCVRTTESTLKVVKEFSTYIESIVGLPNLISGLMSPDQTRNLADWLQELKKQIAVLVTKIEKLNLNEQQREQIVEWVKDYVRWTIIQRPSIPMLRATWPYVEAIFDFQAPALRNPLLVKLILSSFMEEEQAQTKEFASRTQLKEHAILFKLVLKQFNDFTGLSIQEAEEIYKNLNSLEYKHSAKKEAVVKGLLVLLDCKELLPAEKDILLRHIFFQKGVLNPCEVHSVVEKFQILESIIQSGCVHLLRESMRQNSALDLSLVLNRVFTLLLELPPTPELQAKYAATIAKGRNPLALLVYAGKIQSLDESERKEITALLKEYTTAVLDGKYPSWRYDLNKNIHLAKINEVRPDLLKIWKAGACFKVEDVINKTNQANTKKPFDLTAELERRVVQNKHLDAQTYALFIQCLDVQNVKNPQIREVALKTLSERISKMTKETRPPQGEKYSEEKPQYHPYFLNKLEGELIRLLNPNLSLHQQLQQIDRIVPMARDICCDNLEFFNDLVFIRESLVVALQKAALKSYTVQDTDAQDDLLLIGTEIDGSCQSIHDGAFLSKCLMGYIADGKYRAIVLKDSDGKIAGRRILRLLWDEKMQQPVLFQEKLYKNPGVPSAALAAIDSMCLERAKALKIALICADEDVIRSSLKPYPNDLKSLGSPAPAIYVDACGVGMQKGKYVIPALEINLLQPAPEVN